MIKEKVFIRADGNLKIGYGHLYRMYAFAEKLKEKFEIFFFIRKDSSWFLEKLNEIADHVIIIPENIGIENECEYFNFYPEKPGLIVLDGYVFNTKYQLYLKRKGFKLLSIDDHQPFHYVSDAVLNHAGSIDILAISKENYTKTFIGPEYSLIRNDFISSGDNFTKKINALESVLISFGGTSSNMYEKIIEDISIFHFKSIFLLGNSLPPTNQDNIQKFSNLNSAQIIELMKQADVSILSPSTLSYEQCFIGGGIFLIQQFENQKNIFKYLTNNNLAFSYKDLFDFIDTKELIKEINQSIQNQKIYFNSNVKVNIVKMIHEILNTQNA